MLISPVEKVAPTVDSKKCIRHYVNQNEDLFFTARIGGWLRKRGFHGIMAVKRRPGAGNGAESE
jgi:hypothetical protein